MNHKDSKSGTEGVKKQKASMISLLAMMEAGEYLGPWIAASEGLLLDC